jgi:hypothetical protein
MAVDCAGADLDAQQLIQLALHLAVRELKARAQQPHQGAESWAVAAALHTLWQHRGGAGLAAGADQPMNLVLHHTTGTSGGISTT